MLSALAPGFREGLLQHLFNAVARGKTRLLWNIAHASMATQGARALIRRFESGQNFEQRRFAGAVRTDQSHVVTVKQRQSQVRKQGSHPITFTDRFTTQQNVRGHTLDTFLAMLKDCSIRCEGGSRPAEGRPGINCAN